MNFSNVIHITIKCYVSMFFASHTIVFLAVNGCCSRVSLSFSSSAKTQFTWGVTYGIYEYEYDGNYAMVYKLKGTNLFLHRNTKTEWMV